MILADFDYSNATKKDFLTDFCSSEAGIRELREMKVDKCYNFHNRLTLSDYLQFLSKAGYCVKQLYKGEKFFPKSNYRFMLIAEKN